MWIFPSHFLLLSISFIKLLGAQKADDWGKCSPDKSDQLFGKYSCGRWMGQEGSALGIFGFGGQVGISFISAKPAALCPP
jgi:hypothetical protein